MDFFDIIGNTLRETFNYFIRRSKKKYQGDCFEEWVVAHSNLQKNPARAVNKEEKGYWILVDWRSDKYVSGWYPLSSLGPDLLFQCVKDKRIICVECKYRNKMSFWLDPKQIRNYEHFCKKAPYEITTFYYLFGFQWKDNAPKEVYLIPSTAIYTYDSDKDTITFLNTSNEENLTSYQRYKVTLNPSVGKFYIQYKESQQV